MDTPLPRLVITLDDARCVLIGLQPGWYATSDLYPRYRDQARQRDAEPGTKRQLGMALRSIAPEYRWTHGHLRLWHVTEELTAVPDDAAGMSPDPVGSGA